MANERIVILYCGSYSTKALYDKLLYLNVTPILLPSNSSEQLISSLQPKGIIITGSPNYVHDPNGYKVDQAIYNMGVPLLGICYGMQRIAVDLGGIVKRMVKPEREEQHLKLSIDHPSILYQDFTDEGAPVWMVHVCKLTQPPEGFVVTGSTEETEIASMENPDRGIYAVQYHPEHRGKGASNQAGTAIIWKFLRDVCGCTAND